MMFRGFSERYAKDALPDGFFQISQNVERKTNGEISARKGLADTGLTDTSTVKLGCTYFVDKQGVGRFVRFQGTGLTGTLEFDAATAPSWVT